MHTERSTTVINHAGRTVAGRLAEVTADDLNNSVAIKVGVTGGVAEGDLATVAALDRLELGVHRGRDGRGGGAGEALALDQRAGSSGGEHARVSEGDAVGERSGARLSGALGARRGLGARRDVSRE